MEKTNSMTPQNYTTAGPTMRNNVKQSLPIQATTLFVPIGMAEDQKT